MSKRRKGQDGEPVLEAAAAAGSNTFKLKLNRDDDEEDHEEPAMDDNDGDYMPAAAASSSASGGRRVKREKRGDDDAVIPAGPRRASRRSTSGSSAAAAISVDDVEDDEEVYVDVLDDTEDLRGSTLALHDYSALPLKRDHVARPIWVCADGRLFLETYNSLYRQAYDFLIAISDPVTRPQFIHEYQISSYSLYAAASLGLETADIISGLQRLSKVALSQELCDFIREKTETCGKAKLLLKKTQYFVESIYPETLDALLQHPVIAAARIDNRPKPTAEELAAAAAKKAIVPTSTLYSDQLAAREPTKRNFNSRVVLSASTAAPRAGTTAAAAAAAAQADAEELQVRDPATGYLLATAGPEEGSILLPGTASSSSGARAANSKQAMGIDASVIAMSDELAPARVLSFQIDANSVEDVRRTCNEMNYGMIEEYDFRRDTVTPDLPIALRPIALIRDYQEKSLSKMFGNGRARSGIIVLPCGAGKSLVGITALTTIKKSTLIFCNTGVSVEQWKFQLEKWSNLPPKYISCFTATNKDRFQTDAIVVITTYNMVAFQGQRSAEAEKAMDFITKQEWGLVILDEVHVAPAKMFRRCISTTHSRCKLGLTATLVREDELIDDLFFLIGPKLYEANWLDLQNAGYIATVQCVEVWCEMSAEFYAAYLSATIHKQLLLYVMNPNKFRACEYLIRLHEAKGDKVLVFSDNVFALKTYALALNKPFIYGGTTDQERIQFLHHFQTDSRMNTLFISKVGDTSIDLPDVNVIIQISSHFSSRRQEAQRLGRILRPKSAATGRFNAFFYSLVSRDTKEMLYSSKRQRFLVDQGYSFKIITQLTDIANIADLKFGTKQSQLELLARVLATEDAAGEEETADGDPFGQHQAAKNKRLAASRRRGNAQALSGSSDRAYHEYEERRETAKATQKSRHTLFRSRQQQTKEDAKNR